MYEAMIRMKMTPEILSIRFERPIELIEEWLTGTKQPPAYWLLAMKAVRANLEPADNVTMRKPLDLCLYIGAPRDTVPYWLHTGQFPIMARYAVAYVIHSTKPALTAGDVRVLRLMDGARYYRAGNNYTARPVLGKVLPRIRPPIVEKLIGREYLRLKTNGIIGLTPKGKKYI